MIKHKQRGATLIEVMVAVAILSVGLLGIGALQAVSLKDNRGANYRTQANIIAQQLIESMRANPLNVAGYIAGAGANGVTDDMVRARNAARIQLPLGTIVVTTGGNANGGSRQRAVVVTVTWSEVNNQNLPAGSPVPISQVVIPTRI
jgi:type IV pilus assembly protein PilV